MQLTPSVVTTLASPLTLLHHINRGREVHERGLEFLHCYAGGIGTLFAHTFALEVFPCVADLGGWVIWRREIANLDQGFMRCLTWREGIFVLVFNINKDVMSFFFPNHCSMCDWIYIYDQMFMLIRIVSFIVLIIITLYVVILVWGRSNLFCRSLGVRGAIGERRGEGLEKAWTSLQLIRCGPFLSLNLAYIYLQNYMHPPFNPNMLMAS